MIFGARSKTFWSAALLVRGSDGFISMLGKEKQENVVMKKKGRKQRQISTFFLREDEHAVGFVGQDASCMRHSAAAASALLTPLSKQKILFPVLIVPPHQQHLSRQKLP